MLPLTNIGYKYIIMKKSILRKQFLENKNNSSNIFYQYVVCNENYTNLTGPFDVQTVLKYATDGLGSWLFPNPEIIEPDCLQNVVGINEDFFLISKKNFDPNLQIGFCLVTKNIHPVENLNNIFEIYRTQINTQINLPLGMEAANMFLEWVK